MADAEEVTIPWKQNFTYTTDEVFDSSKPLTVGRTGRTIRFMNGAPEEGRKVQKTGNLRGEYSHPKRVTGPVPIVILMHGCSGLTKPVLDWAKEKGRMLLDNGMGVLVLDSFGPRQVNKTCGPPNYHWGWRRVEDAYSALAWLIDTKRALPDKVFVIGRSNGGTTAIMIATKSAVAGHQEYKFARTFAISPACNEMEKFDFAIPVTIFIGDKDMANDFKLCTAIDGKDSLIKTVLFKGVHHGFEDRAPPYVFNGWRMEHNPKADKESMDEILRVIQSGDTKRASHQ
ncbi:dienelactone hydrolase family protein [Bradyrhizobium sp. 160]|nr:dienelactone hydrolase family protein [Bradyrhizobium sp. 160]